MRHLAVIRIKNSDFNYIKYGLKNNYFSIDVSNSLSYSKNIGITQYALLDGTTRVDNISREPASINLQGLLGEIRGGGSPENFVYGTVEKNRLQNQMDLLEALRDRAIFLDIITDERTYRNYVLKGLSFGKNKFGQVDAQLTLQEVIVFGDDITSISTNNDANIPDYEQGLILDNFQLNNINTDQELVDEIYRILTASTITTPFVISLGPISINPDVVMPHYSYMSAPTGSNMPTVVGRSITVSDTNKVVTKIDASEIISGPVAGGNSLHITLPKKNRYDSLYKTRITRNPSNHYDFAYLANSEVHIRLLNGNNALYSVQKGEVLKRPTYSDIVNGIHYLNVSGTSADIISSDKFAMCFVRKQKNNKYTVVPNLLGDSSKGFLFISTFEKALDNSYELYPSVIYIHPRAWEKIISELQRVWSESEYFKTKELVI